MANVGKLSLLVTANTQQFSAAMRQSRAEIQAISQQVQNGQRSMRVFYQTQARRADRSYVEQATRDEMATRVKAMRAEALKARVGEEVNRRLFGGTPAEVEPAGQAAGQGYTKGFLKELNNTLGKRSTLGKVLKLAAGGGVIGGLGLAAGEFNELTEKAEKFAVALGKGGDESREMAMELLKSIPIAGKVGEGLARIYAIVSGESAYIAKITEATAAQDKLTAIMTHQLEIVKQYRVEYDHLLRDINQRLVRMKLTGLPLKFVQSDQDISNQQQQIREEAKKRKAEQFADDRKNLAAAKEAYNRMSPGFDEHGWDFEARRKRAFQEIERMQSRLTKAEAEVDKGAADQIAALEKLKWAEQKQIAAEGAGAVRDAVVEIWGKMTAKVGEQIKKRAESIAEMRKEVETFGLSAAQQNVFDLKQMTGVTPQEVEQAQKLADELDDLNDKKRKQEELEQRIKKLREDSRSPLEKFAEEARGLRDLLNAGRIGPGLYVAGLTEARKNLKESVKLDDWHEPEKVNALRKGSAEAQRFAYDMTRGNQKLTRDEELRKRQLAAQEEANRILARIERGTAPAAVVQI